MYVWYCDIQKPEIIYKKPDMVIVFMELIV